MSFEVRGFAETDQESVRRLRYRVFTAERYEPREDEEFYVAADRRVVATVDGRIVGHAGAWRMGQHFGGRSVPMAGVAAVIVEPQARGAGAASAMIRAVLEVAREQGDVISTLYPAVVAPYRRLGWEFAGSLPAHTLPTRSLTTVPRPDRDVRIRPATTDDAPRLQQLYLAEARRRDGWLELDPRWIAYNAGDLDDSGEDEWWAAEHGGELTGYVLYTRVDGAGQPDHEQRLVVRELVAADPATERALWRLVGQSWSIWPRTEVRGQVEPSLLHLIDEEDAHPDPRRWKRWMTRLLDVPAALEARGYPQGLSGRVELDVRDALLPSNDGPWVLDVVDGQATVTAGGDGYVRTDIGALAAIYTGFTTATAWRRAGRLDGSDAEVTALDQLFSGPAPTSAHYF